MKRITEDITNQIQSFLALKSEEREKKLKSLTDEIEIKNKKKLSNMESISETEKKLDEARMRLEAIKVEYSKLREKRQRMIASNQDPSGVTSKLKGLKDEEDLLEDTVLGFELKTKELREEVGFLEKEESDLKWFIKFFNIVPLVRQYNELASKTADVLRDLYPKIWENPEFGKLISSSTYNWTEGLWIIPRLSIIGDPYYYSFDPQNNFFDGPRFKKDYVEKRIKT